MRFPSCWISEAPVATFLTSALRVGLCIFTLLGPLPEPARSEPASDDLAWVEDIVLRPYFALQSSETGTRRWSVAPKLTVIGGTRNQQKIVAEVVQHLNETLKHTPLKGIELPPAQPAPTRL